MADSVHILHVDDDPDLRDLVAEFLEREGDQFTISTAASATEGLQYLADDSHVIDCIVSDFDMPRTNGIEFLRSVRDDYPQLPFILFTGKGSEEVAADAISAGATDYLQKGGGTEQYKVLANRCQNAVDQYRSQRQASEHKRITEVLRNINRALIYADSVADIEQDICGILSDAEPYLTACIAGVDTDTMQIEPRTWAGADAGYFETLDMRIDMDSPGRHAPGGRAYHEREIAISQNISADDQYEEWREQAIERGFRALAVVPLEYNETLHGLLAVFADRRYAFDGREQNLLTELGQDIAHAMHAQQAQTDLRDREQILDEILEQTTVPMFLKNRKGEYILVNEQFRALFDLADTEVQGQTDSDLFDPETVAEVQKNDQEVLETGDPIETEEQINVDGDQRVYLSSKTPVYDIGTVSDPDDPVAIFGVASDITDRD